VDAIQPQSKTKLTHDEAGLAKEIPPGAGRLLARLVKNGLRPTDLKAAAALCRALDEGRP
jgi:hypothetical protein